MANHYTTNKDEWRALADIDYFGMFVKAYIPFNAWLSVNYPKLDMDRGKINAIKKDPNPFRNRIIVLLDSPSQEGASFRNNIGELHSLLENHYIGNNGNRITFTKIVVGKNPLCVKEDTLNGQMYRVQYGDSSSATQTHCIIKKKSGDSLFSLKQQKYDLSELTACPDFNALTIKQKTCLLNCYKAVMPESIMNLLDGFDPKKKSQYYEMGQIKFVRDNENVAKGLIEVLYNLRNSLFHGELIPNKEANKIYGAAYKILRELIDAL